MNYQNIYNQLIEKRKNNKLSKKECYCEEHHIVPLSEGGLDTKENKVFLTAREHYIAHLLLAKIYDDYKMYSAITYMQTGRLKDRKFKYNNKLYGKMREELGKKNSERMKGNIPWNKGKTGIYTEETRRKISESKKGKKLSEECKIKLSLSHSGKKHHNYGKHLSEEIRMKISDSLKGIKITEETRRKLSEALKGEKNPNYGKHPSEETRRKISKAHKGKKLSDETRQKLSESHRGEKAYFYGKHLSYEHKRRIAISRKNRKCGINNKNAVGNKGHKGLKWITNGIIEKTIPIGEIPPSGFRFGRSCNKCGKRKPRI